MFKDTETFGTAIEHYVIKILKKTGTNNSYFTLFESKQFKLNCFRLVLQKAFGKLIDTLCFCLSLNRNNKKKI